MAGTPHSDEDTLRSLAHGTIAPAEAALVREHVKDCPDCARRLAAVDPLSGETLAPGARPATEGEAFLT
ncbi:MAG TPA: zf-HC2 domain-containing protein, partial [Myxococcales bacterium]|nr:zf-HC2 domain-containing protein [Myxococcales bacterium]